MRKNHLALALAVGFPFAVPAGLMLSFRAHGQTLPPAVAVAVAVPVAAAPVKTLGIVTVQSGQPTSLPTQIPTTMEGATREQIEQTVHATDSEDAIQSLELPPVPAAQRHG